MMDKVKEFGHMDLVPVAFNFAEDDTCVHNDPKTLLIGTSSVADDEVDEYLATLVRWNGKGMYPPLKHAAWRGITCRVYLPHGGYDGSIRVPEELCRRHGEGRAPSADF
jgi:hypothetical protein